VDSRKQSLYIFKKHLAMNEEHYIAFDQYLHDEMTVEEKNVFEQEMKSNPEMASEFETFKELNLHLENKYGKTAELESFKDTLKVVSKAHFKKPKAKVIAFKPWQYAVAASVVILLGIGLLNQSSEPSFEEYYQSETAFFVERGEANANLKLAQDAFNAKQYEVAIPLFETLLKTDASVELRYFYGLSLLEIDKHKEAEAVFESLRKGNSIYKNKAIWYLALSKLKQKEYESCKELLLAIPEDYEGNDQVDALLEELD
jgi:tetratricopeptide (TPR) repeat protein